MKALTIKLTHGKIWTVETSDGKRATSSTLAGALDQLVPASQFGVNPVSVRADGAMQERPEERYGFLPSILDGVRDSGNDGQFQSGRASA